MLYEVITVLFPPAGIGAEPEALDDEPVHLGKNTKSTIISKGISTGRAVNSYRGLVFISPHAENARNYSRCVITSYSIHYTKLYESTI